MRKSYCLLIIFCAFCCWAQAYTVVFKTGKVMQGTLVAETNDTLLFRDEKGVQFSLKKQSLNLEKMKEANAEESVIPAPEVAHTAMPSTEKTPSPDPSKKGKVYSSEDIDRLRAKYGEIGNEDTTQQAQPVEMSAKEYYKELQEAADGATDAMQSLAGLSHEIGTIWNVSNQTGRDPNEWIEEFMNRDATQKITNYVSSGITALSEAKTTLSLPPEGYEQTFNKLEALVGIIIRYNEQFQEFLGADNGQEGRERFASEESQIAALVQDIKSIPEPNAKR